MLLVWTNVCAVLLALSSFASGSNLALLIGTLRTEQKAACDDQWLTISCPPTTIISIVLVHYGRKFIASESAAPGDVLCSPGALLSREALLEYNKTCLSVAASKIVEARCREKRQCQFLVGHKIFGDPCPGLRKYAEIAYKCRPNEFKSRIVCKNGQLRLECPSSESRVAIYSASFGRSKYGSFECPQTPEVPEEDCQVSYATEILMKICHGKQRCHVSANASTFSSRCHPLSNAYLKVVFTCVPGNVLKQQYHQYHREEEEEEEEDDAVFRETGMAEDFDKSAPVAVAAAGEGDDGEGEAASTSSGGGGGTPGKQRGGGSFAGFFAGWIVAIGFLKRNSEKCALYVALSVGAGLVAFSAAAMHRLVRSRAAARRPRSDHGGEARCPLPEFDCTDYRELDADLDLLQSLPSSNSFHDGGGPVGTLKRTAHPGIYVYS